MSEPDSSSNPYQAVGVTPPPVQAYAQPATPGGDATGGLIPYKNPHALIAYYLGLFSLLPCVGLLLAVPAFILGIMGLRRRNRNPEIRGSVHAWIGIVMGGLMTVVWTLVLAGIVVAAILER